MDVKVFHNTYSNNAFTPEGFASILVAAHRELADVEFDTMVGRGLSGALVIPRLADALEKHWLIARKPKDGSHSSRKAEGHLGRKWLFVDDFVSSGETYRETVKVVKRVAGGFKTQHVGFWTYEYGGFRAADHVFSQELLRDD